MIGTLHTLKEFKTLSLIITNNDENDAIKECKEIAEALEDVFSKKWTYEIIGDGCSDDGTKTFHFHLTFEISFRRIDREISCTSKSKAVLNL